MRDYLFRGKGIGDGEWLEGYLGVEVGRAPVIQRCEYDDAYHEHIPCEDWVDPETVGQYTGLTDKNGRKIFEEDILEYSDRSTIHVLIFKVVYEDAGFFVRGDDSMPQFRAALSKVIAEKARVIGNIHDNPELIGGESGD